MLWHNIDEHSQQISALPVGSAVRWTRGPDQGEGAPLSLHQLDCPRRVFAERLAPAITVPFSRRTTRLEGIVHHLGLALGGRPGQSFARRLVIPVSKDTLLRVVRRRTVEPTTTPRVVGVDDWAWKRGHSYGTIICDLEQRRIIDILPDRDAAIVTTWLAARPSIVVIARDRGAGYIQAATQGRPEAIQVADRWHLMENASTAFLGTVKQSIRMIRKAFGAGVVDPALLTAVELRQHDAWLRREDENAVVLTLAKEAVPIEEIVRQTSLSRGTVRQIVRGGRTEVFRSRSSSLDAFVEQLETEWTNGCRKVLNPGDVRAQPASLAACAWLLNGPPAVVGTRARWTRRGRRRRLLRAASPG